MVEQSEQTYGSPWRSVFYWHLAILIVAPAIAFSSAMSCGYVWLDHTEIEQAGYRITSFEDAADVLAMPLDDYQLRQRGESASRGGYWRPFYALSISIDWWLWGDNPLPSHLVNVVLHIGVVLLLYFVAIEVFPNHPRRLDIAFFAALVFAVLPINVQSVTWISGRKDILSALFGLASIQLALLVSRLDIEKQNNNDDPDNETFFEGYAQWMPVVVGQFGIALCVLLAVLSKELGSIVPVVILVLLWFVPGKSPSQQRILSISAIVMWCTTIPLWFIRRSVTGSLALSGERPGSTLLEQILTLSQLWWNHVFSVIWPVSPKLSDRWVVASTSDPLAWLALLGILAILISTAVIIVKRWPFGFGLCWYLLWTFPTSGILTLRHWRAERYLYPASWGLVLLFVACSFLVVDRLAKTELAEPSERRPRRHSMTVAAWSIVVVILAACTFFENRNWIDDHTLFTHAIQQDANYLEGHAALAALALREENYEDVVMHSKMIAESSEDPSVVSFWSRYVVHSNWGLALYYLKRFDEAQTHFEIARKSQPGQSASYYHLGMIYQATRRRADAETMFRKALELNPNDDLARGNLAFVLLSTGEDRNLEECLNLLEPIIDANATDLDLRNYGSAALARSEWEQARYAFSVLTRRESAGAADFAKLAWAEARLGQRDQAKEHLEEAFKMNPNDGVARSVLRILTGR